MLTYCVAPGLCRRWLDDELAVYQPERCETHLLDRSGGELVDFVAQRQEQGLSCDIGSLAAGLLDVGAGDSCAADDLAETQALLEPMLLQLSRLGLLVAQPC